LQTNESNSSLIIKKNVNNASSNQMMQMPIIEKEKLLSMDKTDLLNEINSYWFLKENAINDAHN